MSTTLVTGADGFIGSHLTEALVLGGSHVRALVQYNSFDSWGWLDTAPEDIKSAIEVVPGDLRDGAQMMALAKGVDVIFNLAALISIPYSYQAPFAIVDTNLKGTINLLEAAKITVLNGLSRHPQARSMEQHNMCRWTKGIHSTHNHPMQRRKSHQTKWR